ncbi:MAG: S9 family peptidase [Acidobacteria bacterium]|nr:S9 family peptidase [Acidobacteriota bacterium]
MRFVGPLLLVLLAAGPLAAQKKPFSIEKLLSLERISDPQASPDGTKVLFAVTSPDVARNTRPSQIWRAPLEGGAPQQVTREGTRNQRARWSPDGKRIAWISNRGGSQQVWLMDADGGNARQLTDLPTEADGLMWSPDGRRLLFTSDVDPECRDMTCNKRKQEERERDAVKAEEFTRLLYRHWSSFKHGKRSHLFIVPADGGSPIDLTPGDHAVPPFSLGGPDDYAFSPDGREVAYVTCLDPVEATSTNYDIFVAPAGGGPAKKITANPAWDATPVYSPDGRYIAYRAQSRPGYEADRFRLMLYDRQSGRHTGLTENWDRSVDYLFWAPDSSRIYFGAENEATRPIWAIGANGGEPRPVVTGANNDDAGVTRDGATLVFTRNSLRGPSEIFRAATAATTANPQPVTRINEPLLAGTHVSAPEPFSYAGAGGATAHGWLVKPPRFNPQSRYPVIILIHGGPQGAWEDGWTYRWNAQVFAGAGYVIALLNPRGSTGYGQKFTDEINADWGGKVYEDIMNGVAHVERLPYVDKERFCAAGASYGGYMIDWIAGHTDRFRCLVTHSGVFDLPSMYGSTEELWFPEWEFRGTPWDNPEMYRRWSPSSYVKNFKTPTLVVHGQLDYRVDVSQGFQMFTALQKMKVPSKMLYFPDEGHWVLKPANSARWYREVLEWWRQWLAK